MKKILGIIIFFIINGYYSFSQTLQTVTDNGNQTSNPILIGNSTTIGTSFNIARGPYNQMNITHGNSTDWGLLLGYSNGSLIGNYHGLNHAAMINVQNAPLHLGTNNDTKLTILGNGYTGIGTTIPNYNLEIKGAGNLAGLAVRNANEINEDQGIILAQKNDLSGSLACHGYDFQIISGWDKTLTLGTSEYNTYGGKVIFPGGKVGIGTSNPAYKLDVIGTIRSREVKVDMNGADFVFEEDYKLMPLNELEQYLQKEKHLPEIASAKEMETNGTDLGALNSKLLQKVEELTLYLIEQNKKVDELKEIVTTQNQKILKLESKLK